MSIISSLIRAFVEGRASRTSLDELRRDLETGCDKIYARMARAADTPANRRQAGHVIGIERWGAHRLGSALSQPDSPVPPVSDEYDGYRPEADRPVSLLAQAFRDARAGTLAQLEAMRGQPDRRVPHNELGDLSLRGWLVYLHNHANMESKRIH